MDAVGPECLAGDAAARAESIPPETLMTTS